MKEITISRKSWHYFLARFGDTYHRRDLSDICSYRQAVAIGGSFFTFVTSVCVGLTISTGDALAWVASGFMNGWLIEPNVIASAALGICMLAAILTAAGIIVLGMNFIYKLLRGNSPSVLSQAYESWKDKYCVKVNIVP
jgi:hypothetical protein